MKLYNCLSDLKSSLVALQVLYYYVLPVPVSAQMDIQWYLELDRNLAAGQDVIGD